MIVAAANAIVDEAEANVASAFASAQTLIYGDPVGHYNRPQALGA